MPQKWFDGELNDLSADVLVFAKPQPNEVIEAIEAKQNGKTVVVDYCDDHFGRFPHYVSFLRVGDAFACPTDEMSRRIKEYGKDAVVIPEAYEFPLLVPHCNGRTVLWFGHRVNMYTLARVMPKLAGCDIHVVSNAPGCTPWSMQTMFVEFARADIVIIPAAAAYKSANRAVEAIRQGCFVVAEPHPSLADFPIWKGDIGEGIQWAYKHQKEANEATAKAQEFVESRFQPKILESAWRSLLAQLKSRSTSDAGGSTGRDGSDATKTSERTLDATSSRSRFPPIMQIG